MLLRTAGEIEASTVCSCAPCPALEGETNFLQSHGITRLLDLQVIDAGCKRELETLLDVYFRSEERDAEDNLRRGIDDMRAKRDRLLVIAEELVENPMKSLKGNGNGNGT